MRLATLATALVTMARGASYDNVQVQPQTLVWPTTFVKTMLVEQDAIDDLRDAVTCTKLFDGGVLKSNKKGGGWHSSEMLDPNQAVMLVQASQRHAIAKDSAVPQQCRGAASALKQIDALVKLSRVIEDAAKQMLKQPDSGQHSSVFTQNIWGLQNEVDQYNILHSHPNAVLSGVLHLDDGGSKSGATVFTDPRPVVGCSGAPGAYRKDAFFMCTWCTDSSCPAEATRVLWGSSYLQKENISKQVVPTAGQLLLWPAWLPHAVLPHKVGALSSAFSQREVRCVEFEKNPVSSTTLCGAVW